MENFEKHFREQLAEHEMNPPAGFWHQISDALDKEELPETKVTAILPQTKTSFGSKQVLRIAASVILLLGIGGIIGVLSPEKQAKNPVIPVVATTNATEETSATSTVVTTSQVVSSEKQAIGGHAVVTEVSKRKSERKTIKAIPQQEILLTNHIASDEEIVPVIAENEQEEEPFLSTEISTNSVPIYSLRLLDKNIPENDEITVIDKTQKEDPKKVIIIEKGLSKKPEIKYQLPLRF